MATAKRMRRKGAVAGLAMALVFSSVTVAFAEENAETAEEAIGAKESAESIETESEVVVEEVLDAAPEREGDQISEEVSAEVSAEEDPGAPAEDDGSAEIAREKDDRIKPDEIITETEEFAEVPEEEMPEVEEGDSTEEGSLLDDTLVYNDFEYRIENGTATITGYVGSSRTINIPSSLNGRTVVKIDDWAFENSNMTSLTIPETVMDIGKGAFGYCTYLRTINFNAKQCHDTDGYEGDNHGTFQSAGANASSLTVTFGNKVTKIPANLFRNYQDSEYARVTKVVIPASVRKIGGDAFNNCRDLKTVTINSKNPTMGDGSFYNCSSSMRFYCYHGTASKYAKANKIKITYLDLAKVSGFKAKNLSKGIKLTWKKTSGAKGYTVYRKLKGGKYKKVKTLTGGSKVTWTDTAVKNKKGKTYIYAIRAYSGKKTSGTGATKKIVRKKK